MTLFLLTVNVFLFIIFCIVIYNQFFVLKNMNNSVMLKLFSVTILSISLSYVLYTIYTIVYYVVVYAMFFNILF